MTLPTFTSHVINTPIISVTAEHIAKGHSTPNGCPIALAMHAAGYLNPRVTPYYVSWSVREGVRRGVRMVLLDKEVVAFIKDFDNERSVEPFTFRLTLREDDRILRNPIYETIDL